MGKESINHLTTLDGRAGEPRMVSSLESALIKTLLYFDIFSYPLREKELLQSCGLKIKEEKVALEALAGLVRSGLVNQEGEFYHLGKGEGYIERRKKGNALAEERMVTARRVSRWIGRFPYVRAVMLSGSLSKNYMEPESDIDYFLVTRPGRLWIARTLLILYKKIFLFNSHRNFCVNYFVDTDHLAIEDRNVFTATEVVFLVPTYNKELYREMRASNAWADEVYPNFGLQELEHCHEHRRGPLNRLVEFLLNGRLGDRLDGWCMKRTLRRWEEKFPDMDPSRFEVSLRTRKYVSKHHPREYQRRVLGALEAGIQRFEEENGVKL